MMFAVAINYVTTKNIMYQSLEEAAHRVPCITNGSSASFCHLRIYFMLSKLSADRLAIISRDFPRLHASYTVMSALRTFLDSNLDPSEWQVVGTDWNAVIDIDTPVHRYWCETTFEHAVNDANGEPWYKHQKRINEARDKICCGSPIAAFGVKQASVVNGKSTNQRMFGLACFLRHYMTKDKDRNDEESAQLSDDERAKDEQRRATKKYHTAQLINILTNNRTSDYCYFGLLASTCNGDSINLLIQSLAIDTSRPPLLVVDTSRSIHSLSSMFDPVCNPISSSQIRAGHMSLVSLDDDESISTSTPMLSSSSSPSPPASPSWSAHNELDRNLIALGRQYIANNISLKHMVRRWDEGYQLAIDNDDDIMEREFTLNADEAKSMLAAVPASIDIMAIIDIARKLMTTKAKKGTLAARRTNDNALSAYAIDIACAESAAHAATNGNQYANIEAKNAARRKIIDAEEQRAESEFQKRSRELFDNHRSFQPVSHRRSSLASTDRLSSPHSNFYSFCFFRLYCFPTSSFPHAPWFCLPSGSGLTVPMLYVSLGLTFFGPHVEDGLLPSVLLVIEGAPKIVFFVPRARGEEFKRFIMEVRDNIIIATLDIYNNVDIYNNCNCYRRALTDTIILFAAIVARFSVVVISIFSATRSTSTRRRYGPRTLYSCRQSMRWPSTELARRLFMLIAWQSYQVEYGQYEIR